MMKTLKVYKDDNYEIFGEEDQYIVKDIQEQKYYKLTATEIKNFNLKFKNREEKISSLNLFIFFIILFSLEIFNIYIVLKSVVEEIDEIDFIYSLCIYLPMFIILHELGHISFFHLFDKKIDKVGFKFNYIFPSFFVRMNDTYLLSKKERLIVHSGGMMFSLLINTFVFLLGVMLNNVLLVYLAKYMSIDIMFNSLPMMNSDGYKVILSLKGMEEKKNFEENRRLIQIIKVVNIFFVIVYTIWFIWSL